MRCVQCDQTVPEGLLECPRCFPPDEPTVYDDEAKEILTRIKRARGILLVGIFFLGWILHPLAWFQAQGALGRYRNAGLDDPPALRQILRTRTAAIFMTFLYWALTVVLYINYR